MSNEFNKNLENCLLSWCILICYYPPPPPPPSQLQRTQICMYTTASADALSYSLMAQQPPTGPPNTGGQSTTGNY